MFRRRVHANKLFYCDVCQPGEKGNRGFENFVDVVKHVAKENGIQPDDKKNLHELIRIPGQADFLKIFRCMFCPDEGMSFVGLSEETFLEHARTRHGEKVTRCRPEKLRRECRICGEVCMTDTELGEHIKREHLHNGKYPFAGFGPRNDSDSDSDQSPVRKTRSALKAPPSPPRISIRTPKTSWDERTKDFLKKTVQAKRRRLEESSKKSERTTRKKMKIDDDKNEDWLTDGELAALVRNFDDLRQDEKNKLLAVLAELETLDPKKCERIKGRFQKYLFSFPLMGWWGPKNPLSLGRSFFQFLCFPVLKFCQFVNFVH